ncbi:hypothetical protein J1770_gp64 [Gordonia phage EMoore]|uniref:Uncharacterized protein n=1 Tax=Gordonia phage EMoore TaxID=2656534 RepID=A0A649VVA8_9CAUD|nr:hypothetical protein J1770_gp64 [Gordonia phage EMoore]QGJ95849.1 hypothetical protein SEA_EMOORE_64 [Gordonia phage EMoore]
MVNDEQPHIENRPRVLDAMNERAAIARTVAATLTTDKAPTELVTQYRHESEELSAGLALLAQLGESIDKLPNRVDKTTSNLNSTRRHRQIGVELVNYLIDVGFTPPAGVFDRLLDDGGQ